MIRKVPFLSSNTETAPSNVPPVFAPVSGNHDGTRLGEILLRVRLQLITTKG